MAAMSLIFKPVLTGVSALASSVMLASPAPVAQGPVTAAEWSAMLIRAEKGGTINLGGRRVEFVYRPFQPTAPVIIKGGVFGPLKISEWRNVTFDGAHIQGTPAMDVLGIALMASQVENITFRNCRFTGFVAPNGELGMRGFSVRDSRNVTVEKCRFENMAGYSHFFRTEKARFADNDLSVIREGLDVMGGRDIVIERNHFEDFRAAEGYHNDGIQFFTTGLDRPGDIATRGAIVRDNLFVLHGKAQAIFTHDEIKLAGSGRGYADFLVENNVIIGAAYHGITSSFIDGIIIRGNRIMRLRGVDPYEGRITIHGGSAVVENNEVNRLIPSSTTRASRNRTVQDSPAADVDAAVAAWKTRFRPQ